jgi:hypothetical protein
MAPDRISHVLASTMVVANSLVLLVSLARLDELPQTNLIAHALVYGVYGTSLGDVRTAASRALGAARRAIEPAEPDPGAGSD